MAKIDLLSQDWADLIFKGKNKNYGAYDLRVKSPKRHAVAIIVVVALVVIAMSFRALASYIVAHQEKVVVTEVTQLTQLPPAEVKNNDEIKRVEAPPPPPLKSSIKFTAPKIEKDEDVREEDEIKSQEEIIESKVAKTTARILPSFAKSPKTFRMKSPTTRSKKCPASPEAKRLCTTGCTRTWITPTPHRNAASREPYGYVSWFPKPERWNASKWCAVSTPPATKKPSAW